VISDSFALIVRHHNDHRGASLIPGSVLRRNDDGVLAAVGVGFVPSGDQRDIDRELPSALTVTLARRETVAYSS
jgi:hypothetical protein